MSKKEIAQQYAASVIEQLSREEGFISAEMVDWRNSGGYCEPKIRMENEGGTWEAWAKDGESILDMKWMEYEGERNTMSYYCTGTNGSVIQLEDGRWADTVSGDTSEKNEAHEALDFLINEATESEWVTAPLDGDFNQAQMENYCGNED